MTGGVTVFDCGTGNLRSVFNAFRFLGVEVSVTSDPERVADAARLVLPGVGAFGDCSRALRKTGAADAVREFINSGRPYLGICLGLQILFDGGDESPDEPGLGVFAGRVTKLPSAPGLKIPHMGWNSVAVKNGSGLFGGIADGSRFYFVHSFRVEPEEGSIVAAETEHGVRFASAVEKDNIFACQFHPEKSADAGLKLLGGFAALQSAAP